MNNKNITSLLTVLLFVFPIHLFFIKIKNLLYDFKLIKPVKISSTVISVGNVSLGGTGKTPITISIANFLQKKGFKVGIVSRGYGRKKSSNSFLINNQHWTECGDEVVLLKNNLHSEIPIFVSSNKVFAAKKLSKMGCNVILLDDGFQHRKIHRDIDIVLIGPQNQLKNRQLIYPYGSLREPLKNVKRADITIMTKKNIVKNKSILNFDYALDLVIKDEILSTSKNKLIKDLLKSSDNLSVCSIGDPISFSKTLESLNINIKKRLIFPDHWSFSLQDVNKINKLASKYDLHNIICTEKDYIKLIDFKKSLNISLNSIVVKHNLSKEFEEDILCRLT